MIVLNCRTICYFSAVNLAYFNNTRIYFVSNTFSYIKNHFFLFHYPVRIEHTVSIIEFIVVIKGFKCLCLDTFLLLSIRMS